MVVIPGFLPGQGTDKEREEEQGQVADAHQILTVDQGGEPG
jgi:hypothetical protein